MAPIFAGVLHQYSHPLVAFEFHPSPASASAAVQTPDGALNTLIFVGGLFDNLLTVPFSFVVADQLPPRWRLMQATLSSSGSGWGTSNLDKDVDELSKLVTYIRGLRPEGKVVLLGHSTGSQDTLHYLISERNAESRAKLDGAVLQAPVSDREGLPAEMDKDKLDASIRLAREMADAGKGEELLPRFALEGMCPLTANRWLSLMSPGPDHTGQDDLFSSDFSDERLRQTFGKVGRSKVPFMILYSGSDEHVPSFVDKEALVNRWIGIVKESGGNIHDKSGIVPGMDHNGSAASEEAKLELASRIVTFVESL